MSELSWLPCEGARGYRVDLLGPSDPSKIEPPGSHTIEAHVVAEPRLPLEAVKYAHFVRRFRVAVTHDGDNWTPYIPPVAIPGHVTPPLSQLDWELSDAPAYRVLVKDDTLAQIVHRYAVPGPPADISWGRFDPDHPHRVRIQEWRDGDWQDLHPYRALDPPGQLGAAVPPAAPAPAPAVPTPTTPSTATPDPPTASAPNQTGVEHWIAVHLSALPAGAQHGESRPPGWWEARLELLERWTIPSIGAADGWVIIADRSVSPELLQELASRHSPPGGCAYQDELAQWQSHNGESSIVAVTHLTAGDGLHPGFDAHVRQRGGRFAAGSGHAQLLTFPVMARLDRDRGEGVTERTAVAPVHTVLRRDGDNALREELSLPFRPFVDPAYHSRVDDGLTAILRAWPGPNATSAIHGEVGKTAPGALLEATFFPGRAPTVAIGG